MIEQREVDRKPLLPLNPTLRKERGFLSPVVRLFSLLLLLLLLLLFLLLLLLPHPYLPQAFFFKKLERGEVVAGSFVLVEALSSSSFLVFSFKKRKEGRKALNAIEEKEGKKN